MTLNFLLIYLEKKNCIKWRLVFMNSFNTMTTVFTLAYGIGSAGRYAISPLQICLFSCKISLICITFWKDCFCFCNWCFSTRVSNELGAGKPQAARLAAGAAMFLAVVEIIIVSIVLFALRHVFGYAFSSEKEVVDYVAVMAPLVCISMMLDGIQGVLSGS